MSNIILSHSIYPHKTNQSWVVFIHGAGGSSAIWFRQLRVYQKEHNVLLLDLRGHGKSNQMLSLADKNYCFDHISQDILNVLDHNDITQAHFVGISLGTIIISNIALMAPNRVKSMTLGGAITRFDLRSIILIFSGNTFKHCVPYMWLYRLFAYIMMPRKHHQESRNLFVREAKRLNQKEFIRWFKLAQDVNQLMDVFRKKELKTPTLYIMGHEDHMFLKPAKQIVNLHKNSILHIIKNCGHVCNVEQPDLFNRHSLAFIDKHL
ncbi:MAG: alpha/beta hydrolase [Saccharospirillaceae bacterium]|nr:alpha/beta hydrolase [Pseudomonadales bacterium]NRB77814.1 alpha/beta hydrolase [Saccharospirillaceae bacterium]